MGWGNSPLFIPMSTFFNYDPLTGVTEHFDYDESTGTAKILHSQDVSQALDLAAAYRNTGLADEGIKKGMWKYAVIPTVVQIALRAKGLDIYSKDPTMMNKVFEEIDREYPWIKTTNKKHRVKAIRHT